ncbi:uncharacterized protein [Lolium perenne]|uniref:uncharacterized protein n=1 Tax=Lolium perenne TaxID=4522 RepID=UPI003A9926D7
MAPPQHDPRRPYKRATIFDQQRRRDSVLRTQSARRADSQARARSLANSLLSPASSSSDDQPPTSPEAHGDDPAVAEVAAAASKLRGPDRRRWFARQIMLPEWMVDAPPHLARDWFFLQSATARVALVRS